MSADNVTSRVVGNDLCSGCGVCAGVCPSAVLTMQWSALGELQPVLAGTCPPGCGFCLTVCPFSGAGADPGQVAQAAFGGQNGVNYRDETGFYRTCRIGFSKRDGQRSHGSSGGMATWLLTGLLEERLVDDVLCVVPVIDDPDGRLFRFAVLSDVAAVERAAGSRYYPVEVSAAIRHVLGAGDGRRCVMIGLPCVVHAVNLARARLPRLARRIPYTLALTCGRLPGRSYTEYLACCSGLPVGTVRAVDYRIKAGAADAGNFSFSATGDAGAQGRRLPFSEEPGGVWKSWSFMHRACLFCEDLFGETADAVFMDAWLDGYVADLRGNSLVLTRSGAIDALFDEGLRRGGCQVQAIGIERVLESQRSGLFTKRTLIRGQLERAARREEWVPPRRCEPSAAIYRQNRRRIECIAGTLAASKWTWCRHREGGGLKAYRAAMRPWERRVRMLDAAEALQARARRLLGDPRGALQRRLFPARRRSPPAGSHVPGPSFLLVGVDGTFNYGGEAIIRGTVRILRERWPACRVTFASAQPAADAAQLRDIPGLCLVPSRRRWTAKRLLLGAARRVGIGQGSRVPLRLDLLDGIDVMLSVGGDNYGFMNERGKIHPITLDLVKLAERALRRGKKVVLWGASVGPFDADPRIRARFARHLPRLSLITAREPATVAYLAKLGCAGNVAAVADPAFLMPGEAANGLFDTSADALVVGVNFSPASLAHVFGAGREYHERRQVMIACLKGLLQDRRVRVLLVPHVLEDGVAINDDHHFLAGLLAEAGAEGDRLRLLPRGLGAAKTKGALAGCDAVVAARMHCCVAALSAGVPTLLLAYSLKARGMARYVYGHERWCLDVADLTPAVFGELLSALIRERNAVADSLRLRRSVWEADARRGGTALEEMLA